jgi:hypothetical protein
MVAADQTKQHLKSIGKRVSNMSHIAGHSRRKDLQDVRHLARDFDPGRAKNIFRRITIQ